MYTHILVDMYIHVLFLSLLLSFSRSLSLSPSCIYAHLRLYTYSVNVYTCFYCYLGRCSLVSRFLYGCNLAPKMYVDFAVSMAIALRLVVLALKILCVAVAAYVYVHNGACSVPSGFLALASGPLLCFGPSFGHTLAPERVVFQATPNAILPHSFPCVWVAACVVLHLKGCAVYVHMYTHIYILCTRFLSIAGV